MECPFSGRIPKAAPHQPRGVFVREGFSTIWFFKTEPRSIRKTAMNTERKHILIDIPTVIAISFMAWVLVNAIYKLVEYVGAAILVGTPIQAVSTAVITLDWDPVLSGLMLGFISAGGLWANLITGCLALFVLIQPKLTNMPLRYFLWLFATFSFIIRPLC
jgi:hypothetical protein